MGYEIYQRKITRSSTPAITLNARGRLVFNVAATKRFHDAGVDDVFLLWDAQQRRFAVKPTSRKDPRAVKMRYSADNKWAAISAKGFLEHIGHDVTKTVSYPAVWNEQENMFEVSMSIQQTDAQEQLSMDRSESETLPRRRRGGGQGAGLRATSGAHS